MKKNPLFPGRARPLVFAHRGCSSLAPENTMAAFKKARETGAPGLELDVHAAATGDLVVAHDDTFRRTAPAGANGGGRVLEELSWAEIRAIDVGSFFDPRFSGERPPLLEEALEELCPGIYVDIELKTRKTKNDPLPGLVAEKLRSLGDRALKSVCVSSFNPFALLSFKKLCPPVPTAIIWCADEEVPLILRRGFGRFLSSCDYLKPAHLQAARFFRFPGGALEKRPVVPWTVDDRVLAEGLVKMGCAGIITNRPQDMGGL
jgi:glycerophosphoryl diester phosphodiesterase